MPDIPDNFPILTQKSESELRAYMTDPVAFDELISSLKIVTAMVDIRYKNINFHYVIVLFYYYYILVLYTQCTTITIIIFLFDTFNVFILYT